LFGETPEQWNIRDAAYFYKKLVDLWDEGV